ncbi:MAG: hypothetical protein KZQ96_06995 [Candidatus Thiodiazotropha sp. (ex Lucinoma borealis)]|nr:hypothetical protein [Candidatus Thiodiazotropha sp. (ex Lucinoma borealis)]
MVKMRNFGLGLSFILLVMVSGCGSDVPDTTSQSEPEVPAATVRNEPGNADSENSGMISDAAIAACGGFTIEDAASIMGLPASELEDRSEVYSSESSLCSFLRAGSTEGVGFYLSVSNSIERAVAQMEQGRGMASFAQTTIDRATGTESKEEALENAEGLGEEAYFMEVNGTLNIRVGNVQIQVLHMEDQEQMKKVGRIVSMGLRKS